jgi:hypothetical protein
MISKRSKMSHRALNCVSFYKLVGQGLSQFVGHLANKINKFSILSMASISHFILEKDVTLLQICKENYGERHNFFNSFVKVLGYEQARSSIAWG